MHYSTENQKILEVNLCHLGSLECRGMGVQRENMQENITIMIAWGKHKLLFIMPYDVIGNLSLSQSCKIP